MLSKNDFVKYINILKDYNKLQQDLYGISNGAISLFEVESINKLESSVLKLLEYIMEDDCKMIDYWIYELHFGKDYHDGCVTEDDINIDISTVEKLYEYLAKEN